MRVKPPNKKFKLYLARRLLVRKFKKQVEIFEVNPNHPSLNTELLEPKSAEVYSFRIDRKYRVLFIIIDNEVEIVDINDHYQ